MSLKFRKGLTHLALVSMLGMLLAACGAEPAGPAATATTGGAATDATATTGGAATDATATSGGAMEGGMTLPEGCTNVELSYWNPFTGPDGPFMGTLTDRFNDANDNVEVTMTTQAEYYTQLQTAAAADQLPDVAIVHVDQVATWAFRNVLRPIDDVVSQMGISGSDFPAAVWKGGEVSGKRYSIPLDIHPMTMFYNEDMLKEAGISAPPKTQAEFEAAAAAMTKGDKKGFMLTQGFPIRQIFEQVLYGFGGESFAADGSKATWNSEAGV